MQHFANSQSCLERSFFGVLILYSPPNYRKVSCVCKVHVRMYTSNAQSIPKLLGSHTHEMNTLCRCYESATSYCLDYLCSLRDLLNYSICI